MVSCLTHSKYLECGNKLFIIILSEVNGMNYLNKDETTITAKTKEDTERVTMKILLSKCKSKENGCLK